MSVRIKTEDGDLIVSGKGKDGKDGKDGGGEIVWFLIDDKHTITWDKKASNSCIISGTYFSGNHSLLYSLTVYDETMSFYYHRAGETSGTSTNFSKGQYFTTPTYGAVIGIPKYIVEECNIRQITKA